MAKLVYATISSLDGYVADGSGSFDWAAPDEEVHAFINELVRPVGTHLYGRRTYDVMVAWETMDVGPEPAVIGDFAAIWRAANKVVYSKTRDSVASARTTLAREFAPDAVRRAKASESRDLSIGGPTLAAEAFKAGLVDECHLFVVPMIVGGGTRALPDGVRQRLELEAERQFASGIIYLRYRIAR